MPVPNPILISACLLGHRVRYNGSAAASVEPVIARWLAQGRVVAVCPEVAGGLPTPRAPAEISDSGGGRAVLLSQAKVIDTEGQDRSAEFVTGARRALEAALAHGARVAVLKEASPSCGRNRIYDGSFTGTRIAAMGVTAALLEDAGIRVFSEAQLDAAEAYLAQLETAPT